LFAFTVSAHAAATAPWVPVGPPGGDARAFAYAASDPSHIYLGTLSGWLYDTHDGGQHWDRLSQIANRDDLVLDNIILPPNHPGTLLIGAWVLGGNGGGLYRSKDGGRKWESIKDLEGQSIRALTESDSDPNIIVAGTLKGVFRSTDGGEKWTRISPANSAEIHEVESIAIDPRNPEIIYAGTWHLPWKTEDGGKTWSNIKEGLIDDSDVFSIILDPQAPSTVYLSACSGIYKSTNGGLQFVKVQGIPSTARRTRVLMQDPVNRNIVYAGTTEGLYKTSDAGHEWVRMTSGDVIINDVYVDPRNPTHVMLATDRNGVLTSSDAATSFHATNDGFSQRQVSAIAVDPTNPQKIYAAVLNDKIYGGVFASSDGGMTWVQRSAGLAGRDVYSLVVDANGNVLAGTQHGIAQLTSAGVWEPMNKVVGYTDKKTTIMVRNAHTHKLEPKTKTSQVASAQPELVDRIITVAIGGNSWYAAGTGGLLRSTNHGATWTRVPVLSQPNFLYVAARGNTVFAASLERLYLSNDDGATWQPALLPRGLTLASTIEVSPENILWVGGPEGLWYSRDGAATWDNPRLPMVRVSNVFYDSAANRVLVTSYSSLMVFSSTDGGKWHWWTAGWPLRLVRPAGQRMVGASLFSGVVVDESQAGSVAGGSAQ
jgi:photosystem II stability/assembly factor-like uncharacterized protein